MKKILSVYFSVVLLLVSVFQLQAQRININLRINEGEEVIVFQDEPIILDVAIYNKKAQADRRWNMAGEERMKEIDELLKQGKIKQEEYDREKAGIEKKRRTPSSIEIDLTERKGKVESFVIKQKPLNAGANAYPVHLPIKPSMPPAGGKATLDADGYYILSYIIAPGDLKSVVPGTYLIEYSINDFSSNQVRLILKSGVMNEAMANSEAVLLRMGRYYRNIEDGNKVLEYAGKILAKDPASVDGLSLKGDGQVLQKSYLPALETYNKAVKEYYKKYGVTGEPPEYLFHRIQFIKKEMGEK
jgi:tetratricopeptide (TPR) repeat protein